MLRRFLLSFGSVLGGKLHKHIFQRSAHFMDLGMSDANFAQLLFDLRTLYGFIDQQMH